MVITPNHRFTDEERYIIAIESLEETLAEPLIGRERVWAERLSASLHLVVVAMRGRLVVLQAEHNCAAVHDIFKLLTKTCDLHRKVEDVLQAVAEPPYTLLEGLLEEGEQLARDLWRDKDHPPDPTDVEAA